MRFHQPDKRFVEKYVSTIQKSCFHFKESLKKSKIGIHQQEYGLSSKIDFHLISMTVLTSREKLAIAQQCFQQTKNSFPLARINDWRNKYVQLKEKLLPLGAVNCFLKKWKKLVPTSQKISYISKKYGLSLKTGFY